VSLPVIVLLPLLGAALPLFASRVSATAVAWSAAGLTFAAALLLALEAPAVFSGEVVTASWAWLPELGLNAAFRLDGLSLLFAGLILGIGLLIILYARYYLPEDSSTGRFFSLLLLFMGAMLGVALSENLLFMLVFWELTSVASFLLIGYNRHWTDARQGARMALAVTGGGGLALLGGILLLGHIAGSFDLSVVLASGELIRAHPWYPAMLVLVLLGAFTKSAQFPFHFWLPHAMAAPTPVSAYLHSATMVKAGVFLLARLYPALAGSELWILLVSGAGMVTLTFGAYAALFRHDLKGLLAYSTISHLGLITLLFGLGTPLAAVAGVFHIINHAIFKASLFMAAGIIDHETGTRDMRRLNGLWRYMPHTATLAMVAAASMAGVPLFNGFLSKEMFFAESLALQRLGGFAWLEPLAATVAGLFAVAYSMRFIHDVFFNGEPRDLPRTPHEPPRWMKIPVEVLVALCLLVGIFPAYTVAPILISASGAALGGPVPEFSLAIWHGFNLPLLMSLIALVGGVVTYFLLQRYYNLHTHVQSAYTAKRAYDRVILALFRWSRRLTAGLQNGSLQRYLALLLATALVLGAAPFLQLGWTPGPLAAEAPGWVEFGAWLLLVIASVTSVLMHRQRLVSLILVGVAGLMVSLAFVYFSAPDLALTQLSVEVVSIILLLLALFLLPQQSPAESGGARKLRDAVLALAGGGGVAALVYAVLTRPQQTIAGYFLENSVPGGGGTNVVNVILVDFRGFDTFGEIIVLGVAALGVFALITGLVVPRTEADAEGRQWAPDRYPMMLSVLSQLLLPLALMVSVYIFLRGHNDPGGGFIAGLITAVALIIQYLARGFEWAQGRIKLAFQPIIGAGLLIAGLTGVASWLFGTSFLTSGIAHLHLPLVG
jgi:multicomponent K+:H+ antiporter subunit A